MFMRELHHRATANMLAVGGRSLPMQYSHAMQYTYAVPVRSTLSQFWVRGTAYALRVCSMVMQYQIPHILTVRMKINARRPY